MRTPLRLDEGEAPSAFNVGAVINGESHRIPKRRGPRQVHEKCVSRALSCERDALACGHAGDIQSSPSIQRDRVEAGLPRDQHGRDSTSERRRIPIDITQRNALVDDVVVV